MSELPKRMLGRTGLQVRTLGYGAMELRGAPGGPEVSDQAAEKVLNAVLDAGINFIDTSIARVSLSGRGNGSPAGVPFAK
jgi:aryl-alcohol dehydrogenase-like predicted oxidoreductase